MAAGELKALRIFLLAAEKRNFAQVAREIGTTPASVTRMIAALEEELGVQLFVRTTRQVSLTSDGAVFAARINPVVTALDAARQELVDAYKSDEGRLRINAPMSLGQRILPLLICGFRREYPKIDIDITLTDRLLEMVDSDFDLAIRISEPPSDKYTIWQKICEVPRILVAAPTSPWARARHPGDLPAAACLGYSGNGPRESWSLSHSAPEAHGGGVTLSAGSVVSANNGDVLAGMAAEGAGVALLPTFIVARHLRAGQLVQILPEWSPPRLWLTLYYPPYQKLPPRIASFAGYFEREMPALASGLI